MIKYKTRDKETGLGTIKNLNDKYSIIIKFNIDYNFNHKTRYSSKFLIFICSFCHMISQNNHEFFILKII